ncbi:MAG: hypothetical protein KGK44_03515 [Gammaproteobacteria bacterium]|nr:hypothetical protein [Gammaproteobacteria bacterium]
MAFILGRSNETRHSKPWRPACQLHAFAANRVNRYSNRLYDPRWACCMFSILKILRGKFPVTGVASETMQQAVQP